MPLRQRRAVHAEQQRDVRVARDRQAERLQDQHLARRVRHVIVAAQDQRHAHQRIVERVREEERRAAVGPTNDEVADVVGGEALLAMHDVVERDDLPAGTRNRSAAGMAAHQALRALLLGQLAAVPGIARRLARCELPLREMLSSAGVQKHGYVRPAASSLASHSS